MNLMWRRKSSLTSPGDLLVWVVTNGRKLPLVLSFEEIDALETTNGLLNEIS